jgi:hypothetical protein
MEIVLNCDMDTYKLIIEEASSALKALGYKKSGQTFYRETENNLGLIDFQKRKQGPEDFSFTINLGVFSRYLWDLTGYEIKGKPDISMCHWQQRIGFLLPQKADHWWQLDKSGPSPDEIKKIVLELAAPAVDAHITDDKLITAWLNKESGGLGDYMRLIHLTSLLKLRNSEKLPQIARELKSIARGRTMEQSISEHLAGLGIHD